MEPLGGGEAQVGTGFLVGVFPSWFGAFSRGEGVVWDVPPGISLAVKCSIPISSSLKSLSPWVQDFGEGQSSLAITGAAADP